MNKILLVTILVLFILVSLRFFSFLQSFLKSFKKFGFKKALKRITIPDLTTIVNLLVPILVLWLTYQANQEGSGLLKENEKFLETAKSINGQAETFQKQSLESFKTLNNETKDVLDGASEMNKRSVDFLEASKGSLETFRNTANELQKVLQSNIDLADKQIEILSKTLKHEEDILNRTANIAIYFGNQNLIGRNLNESIAIDIDSSEEWKKLIFVIGNSGSIPLKNPVIIFTADPSAVCIKDSNGDGICNFRQFSGLAIINSINSGTNNNCPVEFKIPVDVQSFVVTISVSGEGIPEQINTAVKFEVNHVKPTPTVPIDQKKT